MYFSEWKKCNSLAGFYNLVNWSTSWSTALAMGWNIYIE
jgi:hypothetical protein